MVTTASGAPITWDTAAFTWQDGDAGKSWQSAYAADYTLAPTESITLLLTERRIPQIAPTESAHLTDRSTRSAIHTACAALRTAEALARQTTYSRAAHDALRISSNTARDTLRISKDALAVTAIAARTAEVLCRTLLTAGDAPHTRTKSRRTIAETVTAGETDARHTARTEQSALRFADAYLTPWQGILSNITLLEGGLTDEAWQSASASPSGYEAFHPFEVGEYTYQDALIRLLLTTGAAGADPLLYDVSFHVDIEDTRESGIADCTADAPTRITLTRRFYHAPRIVLTVLGASTDEVLIPRLIAQGVSDGVRTFDCELIRTDSARASGTIAWMAEGY